ncbi:MAG: amidohydrolase family protein, partial [Planctomycetota bacterium]|nr:amidohydrolase family protein [Planctomycetota bacterium]
LEYCARSGGEFIPYCRLDLDDIPKACDQVRRFAAMGFRGVKFQPMTDRFLPHERRMYPLWETIQGLGLPITAHAGAVKYRSHCVNFADPSGWSQVAWDFPRLKIVIAHMGGNYHFEALTICEACDNVWMDTAHLWYWCRRMLPPVRPIEMVERAVRFCGAGRIVFASEGMTPEFLYEGATLDREGLKLILWKNALRILGEPEV